VASRGEIGCSQGHVICPIGVPNLLGSDKPEENITSAVGERIDSNADRDADGISDWVV